MHNLRHSADKHLYHSFFARNLPQFLAKLMIRHAICHAANDL
jgi:hypothetical protein